MRRSLFLATVLAVCIFVHDVSAQPSLVDDLKRPVTLAGFAQRIVSLAPSTTETLFAIGAGGQIVGITDYCNYPQETKSKPKVGGLVNPNIEAIAGLNPDLILLSMEGNVREDFTRILSLHIPVFVTNPRSLEDIRRTIAQLGELTGHQGTAAMLAARMKVREDSIAGLASRSAESSVLLFVSLHPLIVAGADNFISEIIRRAGGTNPAAASGISYPVYSREAVLADDPDVILLTSDLSSDIPELIALYPEWRNLRAVRAGKVFRIDADMVSRPGPRAVEGLATVFHLLHKERQ